MLLGRKEGKMTPEQILKLRRKYLHECWRQNRNHIYKSKLVIMKKIALSENGEKTGEFFYPEKATIYKEETFHNGSNFISKATGSQWNHEALYKTASGKWVLNCYSQYQGNIETFEIISPAGAARWFVKNEFGDIPEELKEETSSLEV